MTRHILKQNPVLDGRPGIRVSITGHRVLRYARKCAKRWEARGFKATVVRDVTTNRYFVFKSKVKTW